MVAIPMKKWSGLIIAISPATDRVWGVMCIIPMMPVSSIQVSPAHGIGNPSNGDVRQSMMKKVAELRSCAVNDEEGSGPTAMMRLRQASEQDSTC